MARDGLPKKKSISHYISHYTLTGPSGTTDRKRPKRKYLDAATKKRPLRFPTLRGPVPLVLDPSTLLLVFRCEE